MDKDSRANQVTSWIPEGYQEEEDHGRTSQRSSGTIWGIWRCHETSLGRRVIYRDEWRGYISQCACRPDQHGRTKQESTPEDIYSLFLTWLGFFLCDVFQVARWEHRTRSLSGFFRSAKLACFILGVTIILLGLFRDWRLVMQCSSSHFLLLKEWLRIFVFIYRQQFIWIIYSLWKAFCAYRYFWMEGMSFMDYYHPSGKQGTPIEPARTNYILLHSDPSLGSAFSQGWDCAANFQVSFLYYQCYYSDVLSLRSIIEYWLCIVLLCVRTWYIKVYTYLFIYFSDLNEN